MDERQRDFEKLLAAARAVKLRRLIIGLSGCRSSPPRR
jgi:hypothetical protein